MRVLTVGNGYPPHHHGGYELVWRGAVEAMRAGGHTVDVLTVDQLTDSLEPDDPGVHRELRWHLVDNHFAAQSVRERMAMARHNHAVLERHLDDLRPEVVGWWSMGGLSLTMLEAVRRRGLPAVAFVHDDWLDYGLWADRWLASFRGPRRERLAAAGALVGRVPTRVDFDAAASYAFVSDFTRRHALDQGLGIDARNTSVIHSAIHPDFIDPAPPRPWQWRLLYVGRIDRRKGIDTAIAALSHLPEAARLTIAGSWDPEEERRLGELATELGVAERVEFRGKLDRAALLAAYADCDATLFPVRWEEPWGLVPLEAMGRGRPVVASGRGGSGEYLADGDNCLIALADDERMLARAVERLATSPELRERLREHGLATARLHTESRFNAEVEQALLAAVEGRGAFSAGEQGPA